MDKKALILVVDDNSECRALLVWALELHGFQTISASCGLEGVASAIKLQPSLVLTDLSMPDINGYEAAQAIHVHPRGKHIPVVAVSADCVDSRYESTDFNGDFIAYLGKPWEEEELLRIVASVFRRGVKPSKRFQDA